MTTILAIETSTELASAALLRDGVLSVRELSGVGTHSQGILPALQSLLSEACMTLSDCDVIAFGCGPGAFTGIRTTCGIVQGMAYGADLNVVPVVSLQAMATAALATTEKSDFVCVLDARMNEYYWAHYHWSGDEWQTRVPPCLTSMEQLLSAYSNDAEALFVLGNGVTLPESINADRISHQMPHAKHVAELGRLAFLEGAVLAPELAQPLCLRNKIALTTAERNQVKEAG